MRRSTFLSLEFSAVRTSSRRCCASLRAFRSLASACRRQGHRPADTFFSEDRRAPISQKQRSGLSFKKNLPSSNDAASASHDGGGTVRSWAAALAVLHEGHAALRGNEHSASHAIGRQRSSTRQQVKRKIHTRPTC
eukprot:771383-Pleurochrysis_carterae.AAC.4